MSANTDLKLPPDPAVNRFLRGLTSAKNVDNVSEVERPPPKRGAIVIEKYPVHLLPRADASVTAPATGHIVQSSASYYEEKGMSMKSLPLHWKVLMLFGFVLFYFAFSTVSSNLSIDSGMKHAALRNASADVEAKELTNAERRQVLKRAEEAPLNMPFVGGSAMTTHLSTPGLPFFVNGATPDKPAAKVLLSSMPRWVYGSYKLSLASDPSISVWSVAWSSDPSPDVGAFLRRYSEESPQWILVQVRGQVKFDM